MIWIALLALLGRAGDKDRRRLAHGLGLWGPAMAEHWRRLWASTVALDWRDWPHAVVNIGTEWVRLDAQRALKLGGDVVGVLLVALWVA